LKPNGTYGRNIKRSMFAIIICYSQFALFYVAITEAGKTLFVLEHAPGDKSFIIDLAGKLLSYIDRETGKRLALQVFVLACLSYSGLWLEAMALAQQKTDDFIPCIQCCLKI